MSCSDPALARRVLELGVDDPAWPAHLVACPECRRLAATLRALAATPTPNPHPPADALIAFDESDPALPADERRRVADHLATCRECADVLRAVPAEAARETPRLRLRPWPWAAAAGWLLAAVLGWRAVDQSGVDPAPGRSDLGGPLLTAEDVVLSTTRGEASRPTEGRSAAGRVLRLHLVLGEDVAVGALLELSIAGKDGIFGAAFTAPVAELDEWVRPVVSLLAERLPPGPLTLRVKTSSGRVVELPLN